MATREKKPRSVNSDSPTPSLGGGGGDSAPSTPTNNKAGKGGGRVSLSRQKSRQLLQVANEDSSVQSTDDIAEESSSKATTGSNRTTRATKEDSATEQASSTAATSSKDRDEPKVTPKKKKKPGRKPKTAVTALKKTTLIKRKTRPIVGKPVLGKKVIVRKQINAKGKKEVNVTLKEEDGGNKNTSLRNGKPRATDSPVPKRKSVTPKAKSPKDSMTPDPVAVKVERRRSVDSVSKCSDATDASMMDTSSCKDDDDKKDDTSLSEIKRELMEENETKTKILDKMAEAFNNDRKTPVAARGRVTPKADNDEKAVRRSARQRKSTARDKDEFVTPKLKAPIEIKAEPVDADETESAPLTIDTTESTTNAKEAPPIEKDASLSPELVSEGVSEMSVKQFYSEPAFLENNLGIEKDPKLGEIVQVQEKIKLDKVSDGSVTTANGSTSVGETVNQPIVAVKEEQMDTSELREEKVENATKQDSESVEEVEKLKEIIGIVESGAVENKSPLGKEENSGNESPASDCSNDKELVLNVGTTGSGKGESLLKKVDSRSDSDGERTSKQNTPRGAKVAGKETTKGKPRNAKDKGKEDEKAKEEKLRQEKLRVEEKVREEKLRAERLKKEEEKRILEEKASPEEKSTPQQDVTASPTDKQETPESSEEIVSVVEKVLPPTSVTTTLSLTSADSQLVLSVQAAEPLGSVEHSSVPKLATVVANAIALENLPAITLLKKSPNQTKDDTKLESVQFKAELEILPIKEVVLAKEEKVADMDSDSLLTIISRSENAAAAVTVTTVSAEGKNSPLSIIKIQTDEDSAKTAVFKEISVEKREVKAPQAVKNRESIKEVPQPNETKTVEISSLSVTEVLPVSQAIVTPSTSSVTLEESEDVAKQKESHLKTLGLLTHQAASAEKQRRKELILHKPTGGGGGGGGSGYSSSSSGSGKGSKSSRNSESTGTLKTVIKLNRAEKRKRLPLKMTLQKGKGKGTDKDANGGGGNGETSFYIIQNEADHQNQSMTDSAGTSQGRKGHSRSHTTDGVTLTEVVAETATKEVVQKALVIPEKASSFNVHPERLCQDQCFYCGGKFGLYDTPCHIAAMKSSERQQNILSSEVKIKIDSCLCDACFRHVDRKANCPSYRKKAEAKMSLAKMQSSVEASYDDKQTGDEKTGTNTSPGNLRDSLDHQSSDQNIELAEEKVQGSCHVQNCSANAGHTIRRKWLLKMKKTICKILEINLEQSYSTATLIPICDGHYERISHLMVCAMCKRRLPKNHIYYIVNEIPQLERLIQEQGIAVKLGNSTLVVCKLCRYYANLLLKPPDSKSQKAQFIKNYNRRLLQFYERENELQALTSMEPTRIVSNPDIIISDGEEDEEQVEVVPMSDSVSLQRRPRHSRKSTDLTIIDTSCGQMTDLDEVTITPAPKLTNISGNSSIILDADLSFEQPASVEKRRKDDGLDMTKALKANPNISMRELFPGEEELGIHINIPFNTAASRTPEGWAKVTTTLQYDDSTRSMWEELQKPYGNQSSFLRHLILLEKYFRNGDLILSPQAKNNAATYSEAVQNRLRSFDNVSTPPPATVIDKSTILQQLGNAPITIMPAAAKSRTKSSTEPVSLLKSNNPHLISGGESSASSSKRKLSTDAKPKSTTSTSGKTDSASGSKLLKLDETVVLTGTKTTNLVPPELISINAKQNVTITTIPAGTKPATQTSVSTGQQQGQQPMQLSLLQHPVQSLLQPPQSKKSTSMSGTREIIKLPDQLTEAERRETSKPWRPTLIPITPGSADAIKAGPLYQTADGRRLPKLVQVMSGGKPYHISINDYNRMCILRREKLLQQQYQQQMQQHHKRLQQQSPPSLVKAPMKLSEKMVHIPNQILEQNSLIPIANNGNINNNNATKTNGPSSELQQLIKTRKPNSSLVPPPPLTLGPAASALFKPNLSLNLPLSKPISLPTSTSVFSMAAPSQQQQQQQQPPIATSPSQIDQLIKSNSQFLNNFVSQTQLNAIVAAAAAAGGSLMASAAGATSGGSILMDNSAAAAQLLSKIPKSLTVIPQQKQRSLSRVSSNEDQSSA